MGLGHTVKDIFHQQNLVHIPLKEESNLVFSTITAAAAFILAIFVSVLDEGGLAIGLHRRRGHHLHHRRGRGHRLRFDWYRRRI